MARGKHEESDWLLGDEKADDGTTASVVVRLVMGVSLSADVCHPWTRVQCPWLQSGKGEWCN